MQYADEGVNRLACADVVDEDEALCLLLVGGRGEGGEGRIEDPFFESLDA